MSASSDRELATTAAWSIVGGDKGTTSDDVRREREQTKEGLDYATSSKSTTATRRPRRWWSTKMAKSKPAN